MVAKRLIATAIAMLSTVTAQAEKYLASLQKLALRKAAEEILARSPNATGVWQVDEYGTLHHIQSRISCLQVISSGTVSMVNLRTGGNPNGDDVGCDWDLIDIDARLSISATRLGNGNVERENNQILSDIKTQYAAELDGVPFNMRPGTGSSSTTFPAAIVTRLKFTETEGREMQIGVWVNNIDGWLLKNARDLPRERSEFRLR